MTVRNKTGEIIMKKTIIVLGILLVLCAMVFVGCGKKSENMTSTTKAATTAEHAMSEAGSAAGKAATGVGDAVGDVVTGAGDIVGDVVTGAGDIVSDVVGR